MRQFQVVTLMLLTGIAGELGMIVISLPTPKVQAQVSSAPVIAGEHEQMMNRLVALTAKTDALTAKTDEMRNRLADIEQRLSSIQTTLAKTEGSLGCQPSARHPTGPSG